jgi:hypothetical protein
LAQAQSMMPLLENLVISIDHDGSENPTELIADLLPCTTNCNMPCHGKNNKDTKVEKKKIEYTTDGKPIHTGFTCDACANKIIGVRYHCSICNNDNYDLCATCEAKNEHPSSHPLLKFRLPPTGEVTSIHQGITCDGCSVSPIVGVRYKCTVCQDFDLCEKCEESGKHPIDHVLIKMKEPRRHMFSGHHGHHRRNNLGTPLFTGQNTHGGGFLRRLFGGRGGCPFGKGKGQDNTHGTSNKRCFSDFMSLHFNKGSNSSSSCSSSSASSTTSQSTSTPKKTETKKDVETKSTTNTTTKQDTKKTEDSNKAESKKPSKQDVEDIELIRKMGFGKDMVGDEVLLSLLEAARLQKRRGTPLQHVLEQLLK